MIGNIIGEVAGTVVRWMVIDIVSDVLLKTPGYFIVRRIAKADGFDPDGWRVVVAGLLFWSVLGGLGYGLYVLLK